MANVEILIKAKSDTDAAFGAVIKGLQGTSKEATKTTATLAKVVQSTDTLSIRAGKLSDAIGKTSTTLARSADAFGLSASAMRTVGDVADVAQLGFENLSKSAAGFNAASLAVVGAGLAIGTAIGNLLMKFDLVRESAFAAGEAIHNAFSSNQVKSVQEMSAATASWAVEQKKIAASYEALLRRQTSGMSAKQIQERLFPEPPKSLKQQILDEAKTYEDAQKKKEAAAKRSAEVAAQAAREEAALAERLRAEWQRAAEQAREAWDKFYESMVGKGKEALRDLEADQRKRVEEMAKNQHAALDQMLEDQKEAAEAAKQAEEEAAAARQKQLEGYQDIANAIGMVSDFLMDMGLSADNAFVKVLQGFSVGISAAVEFQKATNNAQKAMAAMGAVQGAMGGGFLGGATTGASFGAQFGPVGAAIGAVGGALLGLFGNAKKAREEMNKLRSEFVQSAGGMAALKAQAAAAGVSLDGMFKQKSAKALADQIDTIKRKLQDWDEAQKILTDGMQKYGIAVSDMGAKFASIELDKQAAEMAKFFAAAGQIGANMTAVTAGMKDEVLALVSQYQAAGLAIPAAMRPILEAMLKNGQLTKENGEAYGSLEEAGFQFAETMEGALSKIGDEIRKLMEVLARGFNIPVNVEYSSSGTPPDGMGGGGGGGPRPPRDEGVPEFGSPAFIQHTPGGVLNRIAEREDEYAIPASNLQQLLAGAIAAAGAGSGGSMRVVVPVSIGNRDFGSVQADVSRRRQGRQSPAGIRRF
jgi:hypothetical protein